MNLVDLCGRWYEQLLYVIAVAKTEAHASLPGGRRVDRYDARGLRVFDVAWAELDTLRRLLPDPLDELCAASPMELRRACEEQAVAEWEATKFEDWRMRATLAGELA